MAIVYEWDAEIQEKCLLTGEIEEMHHEHHDTAKGMFETMARHPVNNPSDSYHPVVVRDVFNKHDELTDRQWAYLVKGADGKWQLPEYFIDGCERECAKVPKFLKTELEKAQK